MKNAVFPFLIGKVLTNTVSAAIYKIYYMLAFPFLIGKVLTVSLKSQANMQTIMFPFLIGKVLTTAFKPL